MYYLIDLLKQKLPQFAGLIAGCVLVWYIGPMISFGNFRPLAPESNRYLVILVIIAVWAVYTLFKHFRAGRRGRELMTNLSVPASPERDNIREAQSEEIAALGGRFDEALQLLKKTGKKDRRGTAFLYELPWYVIIGGPGSGKTTLLRNSGLKFPLS